MDARAFRFPAVLIVAAVLLSAAAASAQYFGRNKIQYRHFDWRIYHSTHFDIHYYPEAEGLLAKVASMAESAYDELSQQLDFQIQDPIVLIYYDTHAAFEQNNIILNFIPEGVGAFAVPTRNRMVLPVDLPDDELLSLIRHELTHVFQFNILYQGRAAKALTAQPPQWFMEGMASYFGRDESARDRGFLRDAVVNDRVPKVAGEEQPRGFFAYRFGHAVFDYIEERFGLDGVRDVILEMRTALGGDVAKALERGLGVDPEDFDADLRRWLRRKYLPELVAGGEPGDFGRPFRRPETIFEGQMTSPAASPSGDLVAAFSTHKGDVDVVLLDARERTLLRNLTKGFDESFQYLVAQEMTLGRKMGRDLAFSPDGNRLALFARRGAWRVLVLLDVLRGGIDRVLDLGSVDQPFAPAWSPDGRRVAFSGYRDGRFDIFAVDVETGEVSRLTDDDIFDASPVYAPDGRSIVVTSVVGGYGKLYRIDLEQSQLRQPLTSGESNDTDAVFAADGATLYFTSDRSGADNLYGLTLATGEVRQHTNAVSIVFQPTVLAGLEGPESLVYAAFWNGRFDLYRLDLDAPITEPQVVSEAGTAAGEPLTSAAAPRFEPAIEVAIDDANKDTYRPFRFFLEDIDAYLGVSDDQTYIGQIVVSFSDYLGDRRLIGLFQSVESFQNFDVVYEDLSRRWGWGLRLFDDEDFFITRDLAGDLRRLRTAVRETGLVAFASYPLNFNHRLEFGAGYQRREIGFPVIVNVDVDSFFLDPTNPAPGELEDLFEIAPAFEPILEGMTTEEIVATLDLFGFVSVILSEEPRTDDYPVAVTALVGDTTVFAPWGAVTGRRWRLSGSWAPDTDESGTLTSSIDLDVRQYVKVTARSNLAFRAVGSMRDGNFPTPIFFGGLDTLRGFDYRSLVGDRGFFANLEFRFPLFDQLGNRVFLTSVRGVVFLDVGGAWFDEFQDFDFWDNENDRLDDAVSAYGYGITARLFGLDLNWDFAKRWNFDQAVEGFETSFWIGPRF